MVPALVDSGSEVNLIREDVAKNYPRIHNVEPNLVTADGNTLTHAGTVLLSFQLESDSKIHSETFLVVPNLQSKVILGFPFLRDAKLITINNPSLDKASSPHTSEAAADEETPGDTFKVTALTAPVKAIADPISKLLEEFQQLFSEKLCPTGADVTPLCVRFKPGVTMPVATPPRVVSPSRQQIIDELIEEQIQLGIIEEVRTEDLTKCPYVAPVVLVPKPNGKWRLTVDYKRINPLLVPHPWPMANSQTCIRALAGFSHYAKLDLRRGFDQLPLEEASGLNLMFTACGRVYKPKRVSQGLAISPQHFQHVMMHLFSDLIRKRSVVVYADDVVVCSHSMEEHIKTLREVFDILQKARFRLNGDKCVLHANSIVYLGFLIDGNGITVSPARMEAFQNITLPGNTKQMRSMLGATNFVRQFIPRYQQLAQPLYDAIPPLSSPKRNLPIAATEKLRQAFARFKEAILAAKPLAYVDYSKPLTLQTDASDIGLGAVLLCDRIPVYFISKTFTGSERNWSTVDKEAHAIHFAVKKLDSFLLGHHFTIETDNRNLTYISTCKTPRVVRMWLDLQEYDFRVTHIDGSTNVIADFLSRSPANDSENPAPAPEVQTQTTSALAADTKHVQAILSAPTLQETIQGAHNALIGHGGVAATVAKLKATGNIWTGMTADVSKFIQDCPICQKSAPITAPPMTPAYHTFQEIPFAEWQMDHIGPLPEDDRGMKYVLVVIDRCTRFSFLFPTKSKDSWEAATALLQVVGLVGAPSVIVSDQGTSFTSQLIQDLLRLLGTHHSLNIAYDHQSNGLVERINREVNRHLMNLVMESRIAPSWSVFLPLVARIINSTPNRTIGHAPATLLFGKYTPNTPFLKHPVAPNSSLSEMVTNLIIAQKLLLEEAINHQRKFAAAVAATRSTGVIGADSFPAGSLVLVKHHDDNKPHKLAPRWKGPYRVASLDGAYLRLNSLIKDEVFTTHLHNCKKFATSSETNPPAIAALDEDEYFIEKIVDQHPPKLTGPKKSWKFLVRWLGFPEDQDEWLPYMQVRDTAALSTWMNKHNNNSNNKQ